MPLIIISGLPSSGKTHRAKQIIEYFEQRATSTTKSDGSATDNPNGSDARRRRIRVHLVSDHSLHLARSVYLSARAEKDARAQLYAATKRLLSKDDVVVLDSGNYIKGWRYQLHCEAKAVSTSCCVVHVGTPLEKAREINAERLTLGQSSAEGPIEAQEPGEESEEDGEAEQGAYAEKTWEELAMRFEEPNGMARWDSPLFTVVWDDEQPACAQIWDRLIADGHGDKLRSGAGLRPNQATVLTPATKSDHLYELDRTTQAVVAHILEYQRDHPGEGGGTVSVSLSSPALNCAASSSASFASTAATGASATAPSTLDIKTQKHSFKAGQAGDEKGDDKEKLEIHLPGTASPLSMAHLQRLRRQFIALHRQQMGGQGMGAIGVSSSSSNSGSGRLNAARLGELFVAWLNDAFEHSY